MKKSKKEEPMLLSDLTPTFCYVVALTFAAMAAGWIAQGSVAGTTLNITLFGAAAYWGLLQEKQL